MSSEPGLAADDQGLAPRLGARTWIGIADVILYGSNDSYGANY